MLNCQTPIWKWVYNFIRDNNPGYFDTIKNSLKSNATLSDPIIIEFFATLSRSSIASTMYSGFTNEFETRNMQNVFIFCPGGSIDLDSVRVNLTSGWTAYGGNNSFIRFTNGISGDPRISFFYICPGKNTQSIAITKTNNIDSYRFGDQTYSGFGTAHPNSKITKSSSDSKKATFVILGGQD